MAEALLIRSRLRRRGAAGLLLALLAAPAPAQDTTPAAPPAAPGPTVAAIEIRSDAPLEDPDRLAELIDVEVGAPLDPEDVRSSLRNLQASGRAAEVELYTRPAEPGEGEGVVAIVVLRAAVEVAEVRVEGDLGLARTELLNAVPQGPAQPLSESRVLRGFARLKDLYREQGYFQADVRVAVETDEARQQSVVTYRVASGPRATVGAIFFEGEIAPFTPAALAERLRVKPGEHYRQAALRDDAERLKGWLIRQSYALADVDTPREDYDAATHTVRLTYPVAVGPRLVVEVTGADLNRLRRDELLPFLGEEGYDEALVLQAAARIKRHYQEQGHYHVEVETAEEPRDGELALSIAVDPGPELTLESIDFTGNQAFGDERLAELMTTSPRRLLALGSGRLVQDELDADLENLRSFYALQGFGEAQVGPPLIDEREGALLLTIPIVEGKRQRVVDLRFSGVEALDVDELRGDLSLKSSGPFHPLLLEDTLNAVRERYAAEAYPTAQVSARTDWNDDRTLVDVTLDVLEGPQVVVDRVIVRGNLRTEDEVIRRTLGLDRGEPVSETRLLEVERQLYQLGIFSSVDVELAWAGLGAAERDVLIRVEEGLPRSLTYGVGYDTDDGARGLLGFTHNNVAGRAYTFRSDLRISERGNQRLRLLLDQPYLGKYPVPLTSLLFYEFEDVDDRRRYAVTRYGVRTEAVRTFDRRRLSLAFDYRTVELEDVQQPLNEVERRNRPYQLTSLIPSFFWDRRDDPLLPATGWSTLAQLQHAFPAFGTDGDFLKLFVQQTRFFDFDRLGVLAASARFGGIEPFETLPGKDPEDPLSLLPSSDVFINERFFAGGDSSHRGYERDQLGILEETLVRQDDGRIFPVGGNGLFLFNLELRFPVAGAFGGTVFYDAGNIWADWRDVDFGGIKSGAGVGVRYLSPIGPLRAEVGWKLDPEPGEDTSPVFFLSFGNPF